MPQSGSCADPTCDNEIKDLYECHCCLRLICLNHLIEHVETVKGHKARVDGIRHELITLIKTLELIIENKLCDIERERKLIEQAKHSLELSNYSIDQMQTIFDQLNQSIASNRLGED